METDIGNLGLVDLADRDFVIGTIQDVATLEGMTVEAVHAAVTAGRPVNGLSYALAGRHGHRKGIAREVETPSKVD